MSEPDRFSGRWIGSPSEAGWVNHAAGHPPSKALVANLVRARRLLREALEQRDDHCRIVLRNGALEIDPRADVYPDYDRDDVRLVAPNYDKRRL